MTTKLELVVGPVMEDFFAASLTQHEVFMILDSV